MFVTTMIVFVVLVYFYKLVSIKLAVLELHPNE